MKFVCDRCHTRYKISDEKVKGKVLKIRCKTCGNIVVVREQGAESAVAAVAAAGGGGASRAAAPRTEVDMGGGSNVTPARPNIEWFVAIKGKQHGPMKHDEVVALFRDKKIHERSYCWHEDLSGWTRLRELPDFAAVIAGDEVPTKTMPASPPGPPPDDERGADVVSLEAHRQQRLGSTPPEKADDPFAAVASQSSPVPAMSEGAPRESTRVFIMNAGLHNRDKKNRIYAVMAIVATIALIAVGYLDYAGIVKIPVLSSINEKLARSTGDAKALERMATQKVASIREDGLEVDPEEEARIRCNFMGDQCPQELRKRTRRKKRSAAGGSETGDKLDVGDDAFGTEGAAGNGKVSHKGEGIADLNLGQISGNNLGGLVNDRDGPSTAKPSIRFPNTNAIEVSGNQLSGKQINSVVKKNKGGIQSCIEREAKSSGGDMKTAKRKLNIIIANSGRVKAARFLHGPTNASALGKCITGRAKKWVFPAASAETEVDIPYILTTSF